METFSLSLLLLLTELLHQGNIFIFLPNLFIILTVPWNLHKFLNLQKFLS